MWDGLEGAWAGRGVIIAGVCVFDGLMSLFY